jgi:hypothetical protein
MSIWGKVYTRISLGSATAWVSVVFLRSALGTTGSAEHEEMLLAELFKQDWL